MSLDARAAAGSGVYINPNYWNTNRGRQELRERQQIAGQSALRDARAELERQSQIVQSGSTIYSPEQQAQRSDVAQAAMAELDMLSPLASSGLISPEAIQKSLTSVFTDKSNEHRQMRKAAQEMGQMRKLYESGRITSQQALGAVNQLKSVYGENVLMRLPEYQAFAGVESQVQQEKEQMLQDYAAKSGLDRRFVTWDERENRPTYNADEFEVEDKKWQIKSRRVQGLVSNATAIAKQRENAVKLINTVAAQNGDTSRLMQQYYKLVADFDLAEQAIRDELDTGGTTPMQPDPVQEDTLEQAVQQKAPSLQATVQYPTFATREEATAAAQAGNIPGGQVIMVGGRKARWNGSSFVRVE